MKSFTTFISEDFEFPVASISADFKHENFATKNLKNVNIRAQVNVELLRGTDYQYANPHSALNRVSEIMARYGILVPQTNWPAVDGGELVWHIDQNGTLQGYVRQGQVDLPEEVIFLYFEYQLNDHGRYICFAEVVDSIGLDSHLNDEEE